MSDYIKCKCCGKSHRKDSLLYITITGSICANLENGKVRRIDFPEAGLHFCKWSDCHHKFLVKKKLASTPEAKVKKQPDDRKDLNDLFRSMGLV